MTDGEGLVGATLGHYRIAERLGAGGMGEVYRAEDTTLGRDVAIKVLPESFASDPERVARFEREARLLAALNHHHVAQVYGFEEHEGTRFLVLELAEGEDLSERLSRGPIPVGEAIEIAKQIAEALEEAHEKGIVHRDLKPGNVKLGPDGTAKVLDFGLAKAWAGDPAPGSTSSVELSQSPTLAHAGTHAGVILGTAAYMSPEQARGKPVDKRADIWAFGVVLHEMLTGRQLFTGETVSDVLAAVLTRDVDPEALPPKTPAAVRRVLQRSLVRDPRQRLRDIGEARVELADDGAFEPFASPAQGDDAAAPRRPSPWWLVATAAGAVLGFALGGGGGDEPRLPAFKLHLAPPAGITGSRENPRISPDGGSIAYISDGKLWVQSLSQLTPVEVPGGEDTSHFAWSPDGRSLAFVTGSRILRGGPASDARLVTETPEAPGSMWGGLVWTADDRIVFSNGGTGLHGVAASGGTLRPLLDPLVPGERDFHDPAPMADGRGVLFVVHRDVISETRGSDTLAAWIDGARHTVYQAEGASFRNPAWSATGHVLFVQSGASRGAWALPFDLDTMQPQGEPFLVAADGDFPSVSGDGGTLLLSWGTSGGEHELVLVSREGEVARVFAEPMQHVDHATLSPDGSWVAACVFDGKGQSLWTLDLERRSRNRLWPDAACGRGAGGIAWMADGLRVAYADRGTGAIRVKRADGADAESVLAPGTQPDFSRDGRYLVFTRRGAESDWDIWSQRLDEEAEPAVWLASPASESHPVLSPDGRWLAYESNETGREEVYVRPFPTGTAKWQASFEGGRAPKWSQDGARLFFVGQGVLHEVAVETRDGLALSNPRELFSARAARLGLNHGYSTAPDGGLVTVRIGEEASSAADLLLLTGWVDDALRTSPP